MPSEPGADFVLFDLGGVLVDVLPDASVARCVELGYDASVCHAMETSGAKHAGDRGQIDAAGMIARLQQAVGAPVDPAHVADFWGRGVAWRPWAFDLTRRLTVPYGVLSNTDPLHIGGVGPLPGASVIVYSYEIHAMKPDPVAFERAIARLPVPPERVRYLDDRADNTAAALAAGLQARCVTERAAIEAALADVLAT